MPERNAASRPGPADVDAVLAELPDDVRSALQRLRGLIAAAAPEAVETIAYGVPAFRYRNRAFVSYGAGRGARSSCSFYVQSPALIDALRADLRGFDLGKGTIRFGPDEMLPEELVTRIVHARLREIDRDLG